MMVFAVVRWVAGVAEVVEAVGDMLHELPVVVERPRGK
jgi:hypothetical protein